MPRPMILALPLIALGLAAAAQSGGHGTHGTHGTHGAAAASASTEAYIAANEKMHAAMAIEFTGDADVDFARGMIGHHEGAIDMARIVLEHGADPELAKLAEEIIAAQEREVAFLKAWLAAHGH